MISQSNSDLGIDKRVYVTNENKGKTLTEAQLNAVSDPYLKMSLQLQAAFGLRREEAMKIIVDKAIQGDRLVLDASWCKGGRDRAIPILTDEQRQLWGMKSNRTKTYVKVLLGFICFRITIHRTLVRRARPKCTQSVN